MALAPVPSYAEVSFSKTDEKTKKTTHEFNPVWLDWFLHLSDTASAPNVFVPPSSPPTVLGSRGGNAALASMLSGLASLGVIIDSTTP